MFKLKEKKYKALLLITILVLGIIGLFTYGKVDKYKGLVKVNDININQKVLSSVGNVSSTNSKGTDEVDYNLTYTLDEIDGIDKRNVVITGKINSDYARFKDISSDNVECTLSDEGKEIEIKINDVLLGEEQNLTLKIIVNNAPNNENIKPIIKIKEATGEYTNVNTKTIKVETNSVMGIVVDENKVPVSNIELSINDTKEIKRTYTDQNGHFIFSDIPTGNYEVNVMEDMYELTSDNKTTENNNELRLTVKEVDNFNIETHKYIKKLKLIINGKEHNYTYEDKEEVIEIIKNAKTISGEIEYKLVVKNIGEKETVIERLLDEPDDGLEFKTDKNNGWVNKNGKLYYTPIEGSTLKAGEKREVKLTLNIKDTNEVKSYLNKLTTKGEIKEKIVFIVDNEIVKEENVIEGDIINEPDLSIEELDGWYTDKNYTNKYNFKNIVNKDLILYARTKKEVNKYTVTFVDKNPENSNETVLETKEVMEGKKVDEINNPTKDGYTFICFVDETNECFDYNTIINKDIRLVSKYEINKYTVTFIDNNEEYSKKEVNYKDKVTLPDNPSKDYYTFNYWSVDKENEFDINTLITGDLTLYSVYSKNIYNIKYINDGEIVRDEDVDAGSIIQPIEVNKNGYNFKYWSEDKTNEFDFNNPISSNITLYSVYETIKYDITYSNLTTEEINILNNPSTYTIESENIILNNPENRLDKDGDLSEIFIGWRDKNDNISINNVIEKGSYGNLSFEAVFVEADPDVYPITYNLNGGEVTGNPNSYTKKDNTITLNNPSKTGYNFIGWTGSNGENEELLVTIPSGSRGEKNFTANFSPIEYTITYDLDGGEATNLDTYTIESEDITLNNPSKEGYTFTGWSGTNIDDISTEVKINKGSIGNREYKAHFTPIEYTITYDLDGGEATNPSTYTIESEDIIINNPSKEGYTFTGWSGTGITNRVNNLVIKKGSTGNKEFTANYDINKFTVTFMDNDSIYTKLTNVEYNTKINKPTNPSKAHKLFDKWVKENNEEFNFDTLITDNLILYASFIDVEVPEITHTPVEWRNDKVTVSITAKDGYEIMYKIDEGEYQKYNSPFDIDYNSTIYAYSIYKDVTSLEVTHDITNIDKINPVINELKEKTITPISAIISLKMIDNLSGMDSYKVYLNDELIFTSLNYDSLLNEEKVEEYQISSLEELTTYNIKVEAIDKVGNTSYEEIQITTPGKHYVARITGINNTSLEEENYIRFESLKEAIEYSECVRNECTIELIDDIEESNVILDGQQITLNLNGKNVTALNDNAFINNGTLTVIDNNDDEIGKIYSEGIAITNNGILTIGQNEENLVVDSNKPIIEGTTYGVYNNNHFNFYDGKIIGNSSIKGDVNETPYSFNVSVGEGEKEIATLTRIANAEARIKSKYFTELSEAISTSKSGTYLDTDVTDKLIKQVVSPNNHKMIYTEYSDVLVNDNIGLDNTESYGYIKLDLTNYASDQVLTINAEISSESYDYGYAIVTDNDEKPSFNQTDGRVVYISGNKTKRDYTKVLEKGKIYYLHIGYYKNSSYTTGTDSFIINSVRLGDYVTSSISDLNNAIMLTDSNQYFEKQEDGSYINTNSSVTSTQANSYIVIDLTNESEEKWILVTASLNARSDEHAWITVTNNSNVPGEYDSGRYIYLNGVVSETTYPIKLMPNKINFIHFNFYRINYASNGYEQFKITSIKAAENDLSKVTDKVMHSNSEYSFIETNYDPLYLRNLANNDVDKMYVGYANSIKKNDDETGILLDGNAHIDLSKQLSISKDEESLEVVFSTTNSNNYRGIYNGGSNEKIALGFIGQEIIVSTVNGINTFVKPTDLSDGTIKKLTLLYKEGNYRLFYNNIELEKSNSKNNYLSTTNPSVFKAYSQSDFVGTIYSLKVYDRLLTDEEIIDTTSINDNLLINYNINSFDNINGYINNNQNKNNTTADSYMVFDLRDFAVNKEIVVDYTISSEDNRDYGFIYVTESSDVPSGSTNRYASFSGESRSSSTIKLTAGRINYVHFVYYKNDSSSIYSDSFILRAIKYYDEGTSTLPTYILGNVVSEKQRINTTPILNEEVDKVQIIRDISLSNPITVPDNKEVILDLNGYSLGTSKTDYVIKNNGNLTIIDSNYTDQAKNALDKYNEEQALYDAEYEEAMAEYNEIKDDIINSNQEIEINANDFGFNYSVSTGNEYLYDRESYISSTISASSTNQSVTYYKEKIHLSKYQSVNGLIKYYNNWGNASLGKVYVGLSDTINNDTDFIVYEEVDNNTYINAPKELNFNLINQVEGDYYFKIILTHSNATSWYNVYADLYSLSIGSNEPVRKEAVLDTNYTQTGTINSTTNSIIYNGENAYLDISEAIINLNKEGTSDKKEDAIYNLGNLKLGENAIVTTYNRYNNGIRNGVSGNIISSNGVININNASSNGIYNESFNDEYIDGINITMISSSETYAIYSRTNKKITYNKAKITTPGNAIYVDNKGDVKFDNSNIKASGIYVLSSSNSYKKTIEFDNSIVNGRLYYFNHQYINYDTIIINNTNVTSHYHILYVGNVNGKNDIIVNNSTLKTSNNGYYPIENESSVNEVTINNSTISTKESGIYTIINGGKMTINDTNIDNNGISNDKGILNNGELTIKGNTVIDYKSNESIENNGTLIIGNNEDALNKEYPIINGSVNAVNNKSNAVFKFYDGVLTGKLNNSVGGRISEVPTDHDLNRVRNESTESISLKNCVDLIEENYVAKIDETKYTSIQNAINSITNTDNKVITLIKDIDTVNKVLVDNTKNTTIDLNGHYFKTYNNGTYLTNNGTLTITDNNKGDNYLASNSELLIENNNILNYEKAKLDILSYSKIITNNGTFNFNSGTFTNSTRYYNYAIENNGTYNHKGTINIGDNEYGSYIINNNKDLNISDGLITKSYYALINSGNESTINISGGEIKSSSGGNAITTSGTTTVTGGIFTNNDSEASIFANSGTITISGGEFGTENKKVSKCIVSNSGIANISDINVYSSIYGNSYTQNSSFSNSGTMTLTNVNLNTTSNYAIRNTSSGSLTVTEGNYTGSISVLFELSLKSNTTLNDVNSSASSNLIYIYGYDNSHNPLVNINNSTLTTTNGAVLTTTDGQVSSSNRIFPVINITNSDINATNGNAIEILSTGTLNMLSGNITSTTNYGIYNKYDGTINLGAQGGEPSITSPSITGKTNGIYNNSSSSKFNFYDGIITGSKDNSIYGNITSLEDGYDIIVRNNNDDTESKYLDKVKLFENKESGESYYTFDEALEEINNGDTLKLLREYSTLSNTNSMTIPENYNIILDLNGYRILQSNTTNPLFVNNGTFTITDSKTNGEILVTSGKTIINNGVFNFDKGLISSSKIPGTLIENNGTYNNKGSIILYQGEGNKDIIVNNGYINVIDGTLELKRNIDYEYTTNYFIRNNADSTLDISGGTLSHYGPGALIINNGTVAVSGGDFTNNSTQYEAYIFNNYNLLNITGGTFGNASNRINKTILYNNTSGKAFIENISLFTKEIYTNYNYLPSITNVGELELTNVNLDTLTNNSIRNASSGSLTVTGGNYTSTSTTFFDLRELSSTTLNNINLSSSSNLISIYGYSNSHNPLININDSTLTTTNGVAITTSDGPVSSSNRFYPEINITNSDINASNGNAIEILTTGTLNILSGNITSTTNYGIYNKYDGTINLGELGGIPGNTPKVNGKTYGVYNNSGTFNFYDGIITASKNNTTYGTITNVEPGYDAVTKINDDETESKYLSKEPFIKNNRLNKEYSEFSIAIEEATNGDTLSLTREYTTLSNSSSMIVPSEKEIIFDINGYNLLQGNVDNPLFTNNGTFTIINSKDEGKISVSSGKTIINNGIFNFDSGIIYSSKINGTIIENNGTYNHKGTIIVYQGEGNYDIIVNNNIVNILDGTLELNKNDSYSYTTNYFIKNNTSSTLNISGGIISMFGRGNLVKNEGTTIVTGGNFTNSDGSYLEQYIFNNSGDLTINGGIFGSEENKINNTNIILNSNNLTIKNIDIYTSSTGDFNHYVIDNNGNATLTNLNVNLTGRNQIRNYGGGTLSINAGTINSTGIINSIYSTLNSSLIIDSATINSNSAAVEFSGSGNYTNQEISISNSLINTKNSSILITNAMNNIPNIIINNSEITSTEGNSIYNDINSNINIKNNSILTSTSSSSINNTSLGTITLGEIGGIPSITYPIITGETYGIVNPNGSIYFYDGIINGKTNSVSGTITEFEPGYKENRETNSGITSSTLTIIGSDDKVAVVNNINFKSIQSAVNYAVNNNIETIELYNDITLESNLIKPEGINVKIYLGNYKIIKGGYSIDSGIELIESTAPSASLSRFLANITGDEINPKNIVIYQMENGEELKSNITYKLYKLVDNVYKIVKFDENVIGDYKVGNDTEELNVIRGKLYLNNIGEGEYKLVGTDNNELSFEILENSVSSNIRENNMKTHVKTVEIIASLILSLQTGINRIPYTLMILVLIILILSIIAYKKHKEDY